MAQNLWKSRCLQSLPAAALLAASLAHAQAAPATPPDITVEDALHHMSDQAGVVFVGEVIAIRNREGEDGAPGVVEIEFRIDQAVRGCTAGSTYVLREWAGLWSGGDQRYRIGQRLLMLLHTPGLGGVTSPVGGMAGAIPIRGTTTAPHAADTSTATLPPIADLRWVGTQLQRSIVYRNDPTPLAIATAQSADTTTAAPQSDASTAAQQAPVSVVVDMLTSWQKEPHVVP
ncbi:MAG TPA: hypothetical protein VK593_04080 [Edaphobacter sp.]|nr:hypothetical protein [Edaphobacter sp.]